jgi:hypothetical protein
MYCKACSEFFQPPPDEEKLIITGGLPVLCPACAKKDWESRRRPEDAAPVYPGTEYKHGAGTQLYRADWFGPDGRLVAFIAMPPIPRRPVMAPLRKKKKMDQHVFVLTEMGNTRKRTTPRTQLHTNLENYVKLRQPLKIEKVPAYDDPFTGTSLLRFATASVADIEREEGLVRINLNDGGHVLLRYR